MKVILLLLLLTLTAFSQSTDMEYVVIQGTCTEKVKNTNNKKNNEVKFNYVLSPFTMTKDKYDEELLKKAFENHISNKKRSAKITIGKIKKFTDKAEAHKYANELVRKNGTRTYMTENYVEKYAKEHETDKKEKIKSKEKSSKN